MAHGYKTGGHKPGSMEQKHEALQELTHTLHAPARRGLVLAS